METNEIMNNEVNEEMTTSVCESIVDNSEKGMRVVAGLGIGLAVCGCTYMGYKFIKAKIAARKKDSNEACEDDVIDLDDFNEVSNEEK